MSTQIKSPEFIEFNENLKQALLQLLQNYPFKEVVGLIAALNASKFDTDKGVFKVPYITADACYLILSREPAVIAVKALERIAMEAQQAHKLQNENATKDCKAEKKDEVKPDTVPKKE